jgi:hypothetical protein
MPVESTRSQNITVTMPAFRGDIGHGGRRRRGSDRAPALPRPQAVWRPQPPPPACQSGDRAQELAAMAKRGHADLLQVLIGQVTEDREIDVVLGKSGRTRGGRAL